MAEQWQQRVHNWVNNGSLMQAILSQPRRKDNETASKTIVRAIMLKQELYYQFEYHTKNKVIHENMKQDQAAQLLVECIEEQYRQVLFRTKEEEMQLLLSKKGKPAWRGKQLQQDGSVNAGNEKDLLAHNRQKQRVLQEGQSIPFLVELGIMTKDGKVHAKKHDKYKQINRFLEMVSDILPSLPEDRPLTIVDFGCGKSYLTFALYHLLAVEQQRDIQIIGLDLKEDVIQFCNNLAQTLEYSKLKFLVGDIAQYNGLEQADMVVTLHACDTATDAALAKAVAWGASVIMSVPCCQHELFRQIKSDELSPLLSHGLLKERFSALATDAARGALLETTGYKVQMLEFIDAGHTPKNIMIRAVKTKQLSAEKALEKQAEYTKYKQFLRIEPALESMLEAIKNNQKQNK